MPILKLLNKVFKNKAERDHLKLRPQLEATQTHRDAYQALSDDEMRAKTVEFRERLSAGETLEDILPEAYANVWEACRRLTERKAAWPVQGHDLVWDMVPYDVQIIGAIALHQGRITEMATGEGKTLVATMPLYLNALAGEGAHLVTVNDYLAQRDAEWMGGIYEFLGLSCAFIRNEMTPAQRRDSYNSDITYGTNNEFGFDYLRDNMCIRADDLVQRGFHYAIVDEVDSVLVDEARTPLIISGPVGESTHRFEELNPFVDKLVRKQGKILNDYLSQIERHLKADDGIDDETSLMLLRVSRGGGHKMSRYMKVLKHAGVQDAITRTEGRYMRDKAMWEADQDLLYVIDEKQNSVDMTERGRAEFGFDDPDFFVLPDLSEELGSIEGDESLTPEEKAKKVDALHRQYGERNEGIHNVQQLVKAYTLFTKDDEYVVMDGKVQIVDENTGRLMSGRRFSDGLHSALEAKEGLRIEAETQTYATVTLQNFFRMYDKLAGMTGTAETEAGEFHEIYGLDVMVIPTHRPITREDRDDQIYRTKREKYNAIVEEVARLNAKGLPVLVGTTTVEVSETLSRMLRRRNIRHNVLNAKQHAREADIITEAGRSGAVTIATNMAGRGTDIKLGPGVLGDDGKELERDGDPTGLQIVGSERHDSRRIDRQLRGRAGRQGDPGSSQFYLSLEDDLMRLFGGIERVSRLMEKMGVEEGEVITHSMVTKAIERAQRKVEENNFSIRKRLLEYDDVMNKQREVVYSLRREALVEEDISAATREHMDDVLDDLVDEHANSTEPSEYWDWDRLSLEFTSTFLTPLPVPEPDRNTIGSDRLREVLGEAVLAAYHAKEQRITPELTRQLERFVTLRAIDELWKDHLHELDMVRAGIGLRAYGQKDPLLEYKGESFKLFEAMMMQVRREIVSRFFRYELAAAPPTPTSVMAQGKAQARSEASHAAPSQGSQPEAAEAPAKAVSAIGLGSGADMSGVFDKGKASKADAASTGAPQKAQQPVVRDMPKVGRNEPCPCGSGKKFKKCHGVT